MLSIFLQPISDNLTDSMEIRKQAAINKYPYHHPWRDRTDAEMWGLGTCFNGGLGSAGLTDSMILKIFTNLNNSTIFLFQF